MSFQAMAEAVKVKLPAAKKCLLMMLANYADENGCCYPSVSTLALDSGLSERSVQNYLRDFAEHGLIEIRQRKTETGSTSSNLYVLSLQNAPKVKKPRKARNQRGANAAPYPEADAPQGAADAGEGCKPCGGGVQTVRGTRGANPAPKPISKPTSEPITEPETPPARETDFPERVDLTSPTVTPPADDPLFDLDTQQPAPPAESRERFAMHWEWVPGPQFRARCQSMGVMLAHFPAEQQEFLLGEFRSYWTDQATELNQGQWEHKLATRLKSIASSRYSSDSGAGAQQLDPRQRRSAVTESVMNVHDTNW